MSDIFNSLDDSGDRLIEFDEFKESSKVTSKNILGNLFPVESDGPAQGKRMGEGDPH